jgi:hypothetical protein
MRAAMRLLGALYRRPAGVGNEDCRVFAEGWQANDKVKQVKIDQKMDAVQVKMAYEHV